MPTEDRELIRQALEGERCAYAELVRRYRDVVCGVAYHYLRDFEDAQDAAQEALIQAYLHLRELRDRDKFAPWLRRLTMNRCADALRRRGQRLLSLDEAVEGEAAVSSRRSEDGVEQLATRLLTQQALSRLSEKTRLTVTLSYISGYSHEEIARFLEVPINTVRSRLQNAKRRLREEMLTMVNDTLNQGRPDPDFTRQVVEEALRRSEEAQRAYARGDALRYYDEALTALDRWEPDAEQRRLKMDVLWKKGDLTDPFHAGYEAAASLFEQALEIAVELGDRKSQADKLIILGQTYSNAGQRDKARAYYRQALAIYEEIGDIGRQGAALLSLGALHLYAGEYTEARRDYALALPLLEAAQEPHDVALCRAHIDLQAEIENIGVPLLGLRAGGDVLTQRDGVCAYGWGFSNIINDWSDRPEEQPLAMIESLFPQIGHLHTFLDANVPDGGSWSGETSWNGSPPLQVTVTVLSDKERVVVPAGEFADCLLTEQITTESDRSGDASEEARQSARRDYCGRRRAWYAPGVGLVQLHAERSDGVEAVMQLREVVVPGNQTGYLPLAIGNAWTYGWANVPEEYVAEDVYRVTGQQAEAWYLEHYGYAYRRAADKGGNA